MARTAARSTWRCFRPARCPDQLVCADNEGVIRTRFTDLMGIDHPVVLAGMSGDTSPELVAAVSNAGGLGIYGATSDTPEQMAAAVAAIREKTRAPFGLNLLLAFVEDNEIRAALETKPSVLSTAWPRDDQDLKAIFAAAHERGVKVLHMVAAVGDAVRAAEAGPDGAGLAQSPHRAMVGPSQRAPPASRTVARGDVRGAQEGGARRGPAVLGTGCRADRRDPAGRQGRQRSRNRSRDHPECAPSRACRARSADSLMDGKVPARSRSLQALIGPGDEAVKMIDYSADS